MIGLRMLPCAVFLLCVAGCSSGRYYSHPEMMVPVSSADAAVPAGLTAGTCAMPVAQAVPDSSTASSDGIASNGSTVSGTGTVSSAGATSNTGMANSNKNTVFVHPGMLSLSARWDQGLAVDGGKWLVSHGYAARIFELNGRDPERIAQVMARDPGTRFIGLHYSMGGSADLVVRSVAATARAAKMSGRQLSYFPIVIDPASFTSVGERLDMNSPYLGQMFVLVSEEGSALRTSITSVSRKVLDHAKTHLLYAEDFGLNWSHFGVLEGLTAEQPTGAQKRVQDVFDVIARGIDAGTDPAQIEAQLDALKVDYARADERPILRAWLQHTQGACGTQRTAQQVCDSSTQQTGCGVETVSAGRL
ncbi:ABC transporter substrate-binding protein [Bordetella tumbae]|uniref:hypothetical protein n=1 Tax=Bordetella tumbae TaxID=1649139 RepID=UPI0039F0D8EA